MTTPRGTVVRAGRALERFAESGNAVPTVFGIGLAVYAAVSFALPLQAGRDLPRYLLVYGQLFDAHVVIAKIDAQLHLVGHRQRLPFNSWTAPS